MSTAAFGSRSAAVAAAIELRIRDLERGIGRIPSRTLNGSPEYQSKRINATTTGWSVGTWVKLQGGAWTTAATSSSFAPDALGVVLLVIDGTTAEIVTGGYVQLLGTSYTVYTAYYLSTSAGVATSSKPAAPNVDMPLFIAHQDGWIEVIGPAIVKPRSITLAGLRDVDSTTVGSPSDGDLLTFDHVSGLWKAASGASALGTRTALSVVGRSANTNGAAADIVASTTGDVLYMGASSLVWGPLGTASYQALSVTAAKLGTDVVLDTLNDVTIASVAALNFLRYDSGTGQWKNYDLGPLTWTSASREFALDGGGSASAASVVGIGKAGSRLYVTSGTGLDFGISGSVGAGNDKSVRVRLLSSTELAIYDNAPATFASGDKIISIGLDSSSTYANRFLCSLIPLQVRDDSGTGSKDLVIKSTAAQLWTIGDDIGPSTWLTMLGTSGDSYGRRIKLGCDLDNAGGWTLYGDRSNGTSSSRLLIGASDGTWYQSGNHTITAGGSLTLVGTGTSGIFIGAATSDKIGFWGHTPTTKTTVASAAAITTSQTAGGTYTANEQAMLAALKADVIALRATLLNVTDAGQAVGLF